MWIIILSVIANKRTKGMIHSILYAICIVKSNNLRSNIHKLQKLQKLQKLWHTNFRNFIAWLCSFCEICWPVKIFTHLKKSRWRMIRKCFRNGSIFLLAALIIDQLRKMRQLLKYSANMNLPFCWADTTSSSGKYLNQINYSWK